MKSAAALALDYRPSRLLAASLILVCACAVAAVAASGLDPLWRMAAVGLGLACAVAGGWRLARPPFRAIVWRGSGWLLLDHDGREWAAELRGHRRLGALVALDFRTCAGRCFRPLFAPDNLDVEQFRQLALTLARGEFVRTA